MAYKKKLARKLDKIKQGLHSIDQRPAGPLKLEILTMSVEITANKTLGTIMVRGVRGSAKIIKGLDGEGFKWRVYFFGPNDLKADEWADTPTKKACMEFAMSFVTKGYC